MPPSSFKYFRVTVYNGTKDPLDILSAGDYYSFQYKWNNPYTLNPESGYRQVDSADGWSYIFVHDSLLFHKVMINMKMIVPGFYRRNCALLVNGKAVTNFSISGDSLVSRPVPLFNAGDWVVKIYNGDNPALKIRSVYTFQLDNRIIAWLDSGKAYHLEMNDSLAVLPVYDLEKFRDSIPDNIDEIKFGAIQPIPLTSKTSAGNVYFTRKWLWTVIIFALVVMLLFTIKLVKDVSAKQ